MSRATFAPWAASPVHAITTAPRAGAAAIFDRRSGDHESVVADSATTESVIITCSVEIPVALTQEASPPSHGEPPGDGGGGSNDRGGDGGGDFRDIDTMIARIVSAICVAENIEVAEVMDRVKRRSTRILDSALRDDRKRGMRTAIRVAALCAACWQLLRSVDGFDIGGDK